MINLASKPFFLKDRDIEWVNRTIKSMSLDEKVSQLFCMVAYSEDKEKAAALNLPPEACMVFEDSLAGIEAAKIGGMTAIGVGKAELLPGADCYIANFTEMMD